jgi:O-acetyl-ADP-ribose deacetylase (regulator of RNase III)
MGSGIAKEIRARYPQAYDADSAMSYTYQKPVLKLGNFSVAADNPIDPKFEIVNAYTQLNYLPRGVDHFEYESFELILRKLEVIAPDARYGFPYIGMGLAGGDSKRIVHMLCDFADRVEKTGGSATLVEFG